MSPQPPGRPRDLASAGLASPAPVDGIEHWPPWMLPGSTPQPSRERVMLLALRDKANECAARGRHARAEVWREAVLLAASELGLDPPPDVDFDVTTGMSTL